MSQVKRRTALALSPMRARECAIADHERASELESPRLPEHPIGKKFLGVASAEMRAEWIRWIDDVARRWPAPLSAQDLAKISGAPMNWCVAMLEEWRAHLT